MQKSLHSEHYQALLNALVDARIKKNVSQAELAKAVNKPQSFVSKFENGERRLDVIEFIIVCKALRVDARKIFNHVLRLTGTTEH